jgi:hypothetical protein
MNGTIQLKIRNNVFDNFLGLLIIIFKEKTQIIKENSDFIDG